jgi:hypothetical protein
MSLAAIKKRKITILIDDFSSFAGHHPEYASYFIHDADGPVIGLDCSSAIARSYWLPSLAHEMVHALLDGKGMDSWWEEAVAQSVESEVGGEQPGLALQDLGNSKRIPILLDQRRPLPDHDAYAISYLFGKYLRAMFGGWPTLSNDVLFHCRLAARDGAASRVDAALLLFNGTRSRR